MRTKIRWCTLASVLVMLSLTVLGGCGDNGSDKTASPDTAEPLRISVEEVKERMDSGEPIFFIDSRAQSQWDDADTKLPGAVHITDNKVHEHLNEIPQDRAVVIYCT